ncbi:MAG: hypothetical protein OEU54_05735 [Gemmatimonadota bacterium]|nr:hypothetical protein [Gemmatimonadota bacterium]
MRFISFRRGRLFVALGFVGVGVALILAPRALGWQWSGSATLTDLGSEFLGLALAVSILDWFFEQRRLRSDGRRLAWEVFHQVERAVWVWQGGPFRLETDELLGLLNGVSEDDEFADCTERLLLGLGIRGRQLLKGERSAVGTIPGLGDALSELAGLARIGEGRKPSARAVRSALQTSTRTLAGILDLSAPQTPARLIRDRSARVEAQEQRFAIGLAAAAA